MDLELALKHCHIEAKSNKRRILNNLVPLRLRLGEGNGSENRDSSSVAVTHVFPVPPRMMGRRQAFLLGCNALYCCVPRNDEDLVPSTTPTMEGCCPTKAVHLEDERGRRWQQSNQLVLPTPDQIGFGSSVRQREPFRTPNSVSTRIWVASLDTRIFLNE